MRFSLDVGNVGFPLCPPTCESGSFGMAETESPGQAARTELNMSSSDHPPCHGALLPGLLVKDSLGVRKRIKRVQDDVIFWEYVNQAPEGQPQENSTAYEDFADSHFVLPQPGSTRGAA